MTPPIPPHHEDFIRLSALAREGGAVAPVLLRLQADLFAQARRRDEATVSTFADVTLRLLAQVDVETAAYVAGRVSALPETPLSLLAALAAAGSEAARLVAALAPHALAEIGEPEPLFALTRARRDDLSLDEIARLVARDDRTIDRALAENRTAVLQGRALATLIDRARSGGPRAGPVARALVLRAGLTPDDLAALFDHADEPMRGSILVQLAARPRTAAQPLARPRLAAETVAALVESACRGDRSHFGSRLAATLGLETTPDWRFDDSARHDLLALALLAAGVSEEKAIFVFLTLHPAMARSVAIVFRLVALTRTTPRSVAGRVVEAVFGVEIRARTVAARHVPVLSQEERRRAKPFSSVLPGGAEIRSPKPNRAAT